MDKLNGVLCSYQNDTDQQELAAQALMGGILINGKLPVTIGKDFPAGIGLSTQKIRFGFADPLDVGIDSRYLAKIDSIVEDGIKQMAYPGSQVLIAQKRRDFL